ncbi:hypothetical protein ABID21_003769 [Pseudorhizobium tarimense]|uniref:Uncharacterized protein n=1 Tax=Pseudorhizobium tarimense TaxID=1079109 RepID=A0ABV2HAS8_9HYPH
MQKTRRAQAVAIAQAQERAQTVRVRLFVVSVCAIAALLSLPAVF